METAYKAVMKPKEGTILTVAKRHALTRLPSWLRKADGSGDVFRGSHCSMQTKSLARTPEMLPVLKEAGVVDSGGQGLMQVLKGAFDGFLGKEVDYHEFERAAERRQ